MTSALLRHYRMMARYNAGANRILYEACAKLSDAERKRVRPAFFKSIHGTLNHILLGDRIWLGRFEGHPMPSTNLDRILYEDFSELRAAREAEDRLIEAFFADLTEAFVGRRFQYVNNSGQHVEGEAQLYLAQMFNHQTHHRGQVHDQLCQTEVPPPPLDVQVVLRDVAF